MFLVQITIRIVSFAIASALLACTASPRSGQRLVVGGQPVLFSGYVEEPGIPLRVQYFDWQNKAWRSADRIWSSTERSTDECHKDWYWWGQRVGLPLVPPPGPERSAFWPMITLGLPGAPQLRARVIKEATGKPLVSFSASKTCTPSRNCGDVVAAECGETNGDIFLTCPVPSVNAVFTCGE